MNHKLVSGSVAMMLMAAPLTSPIHPKPAAAAPASPESTDVRSELMSEQQAEADRLERQLPRISHIKEPVPPSPPPAKPVSPYAVRVAPAVYRPFANAVAVAYPRTGGNHFYWGYCTWWAASRRYIPWFGNASEWAWNAVAYGFRIGYQPIVGAIWQSGNHVAYVEAVFANGSYRISEMNWYQNGGGFGKVDYRTLPSGSGGVFIYY